MYVEICDLCDRIIVMNMHNDTVFQETSISAIYYALVHVSWSNTVAGVGCAFLDFLK